MQGFPTRPSRIAKLSQCNVCNVQVALFRPPYQVFDPEVHHEVSFRALAEVLGG